MTSTDAKGQVVKIRFADNKVGKRAAECLLKLGYIVTYRQEIVSVKPKKIVGYVCIFGEGTA